MTARQLLAVMLAPPVGLLALTGRLLVSWQDPLSPASFLHLFSLAAYRVALPEFALLVLGGLFLGLVAGSRSDVGGLKGAMPFVLAGASVVLFPVLSLLDLETGASGFSHNLLGIEWWCYGVDGVFVLAGVFGSRVCLWRRNGA